MKSLRMIHSVVLFAGVLLCFGGAGPFRLQAEEKLFEELPQENLASIARANRFLIKCQNADGSWGVDPGCSGDITCTSLVGMALLSAGITERDGPPEQVRALRRAAEYVIKSVRRPRNGVVENNERLIQSKLGRQVHSFFAATFLTQLFGMRQSEGRAEDAEELRQVIGTLTDLIAKTQEPDGSWHKESFGSLQATGMAWMALRSAASTGVPIHNAAADKTVQFVKKQYSPSRKLFDCGGQMSGYQAMYATATGVRVLTGQGEGRDLRTLDAVDTFMQKCSKGDWAQMFLTVEGEDYLSAAKVTHALIDNDKERFERWFTFVGKALLKRQNADGSWMTTACLYGRIFPTSCALITLQAPYRYLPLQQ